MKRFLRFIPRPNRQQSANGMSVSVAVVAMLFLHLESSPTPAGANVARRIVNKQSLIRNEMKSASSSPSNEAFTGISSALSGTVVGNDLNAKIQLLERGLEFLSKTPDYTAQFLKQELVNGELLDEQEMELKVRHAPFSVYMKWVTGEVGREVLYVDGKNEGRMTAHGGGWRARLPSVNLEPTGSMAMAESRHPITRVGLLSLTKMMVDIHRQDLQKQNVARFEKLADQIFDGRVCHAFLIEYKDRKGSEHYRKSISLIDKEWSIPVYTKNFGWLNGEAPADPDQHDEQTLIENYSYANVRFRLNLASLVFDHSNDEYGFKRQ